MIITDQYQLGVLSGCRKNYTVYSVFMESEKSADGEYPVRQTFALSLIAFLTINIPYPYRITEKLGVLYVVLCMG